MTLYAHFAGSIPWKWQCGNLPDGCKSFILVSHIESTSTCPTSELPAFGAGAGAAGFGTTLANALKGLVYHL